MSNLIVTLFNRMCPVVYVRFICKGFVCERVKTQGKVKSKFSQVAREKFSHEVMHVPSI